MIRTCMLQLQRTRQQTNRQTKGKTQPSWWRSEHERLVTSVIRGQQHRLPRVQGGSKKVSCCTVSTTYFFEPPCMLLKNTNKI